MTTLASQSETQSVSAGQEERAGFAWLVVLCCAAGILAALPVIHSAYQSWTTDPLRSVGVFFPVVALLLLVRGYREFPGPMRPTLWGLLPAVLAVGLLTFCQRHQLILAPDRHSELDLLPSGAALSLLCASVLLLTGGPALLRRLLFPVVLLGITNPVPHMLSEHLDLPLQRISAEAARRFAVLIGQHPTGAQLQLMFTPDFGMFIAPGCNGIRGAVTLGYLALFGAVWRRLRPAVCAAFLLAGVALGYLFNFLRLFTLVLYYRLGESFPAVQPYGTQVDYAIGGVLFLAASYGLGRLVFQSRPAQASATARPVASRLPSRVAAGLLAFVAICAAPAVLNVKTLVQDAHATRQRAASVDWLPEAVGGFHLVKKWDDFSEERIRLYHWGMYSNGNPADDVALGLWMPPTEHDVRYSHAVRGEQMVQEAPMLLHRAETGEVGYATYLLPKDDRQELVASLLCRPCGGSVPGQDSRHGLLVVRSVEPEPYFARAQPHNIVLTHDAPAMIVSDVELRRPVEQFLAGLNEDALLVAPQ